MLPIERQNKIKELITEKHSMKISELSKELNVSEMTIHRDLKPLIDEGLISKTFGGITLVHNPEDHFSPSIAGCVICGSKIQERLAYRLILPDSKIETACCTHCGLLRHSQLGDQVVQAICYDFLRQITLSAPTSWFVMDTTVHIGCCQPQIISFELKDHAEKFVSGFGGDVYTFKEVMNLNRKKMNGEGCHPSHSST
ncbi:DeoR family transcriptional regulator [Ornithinibacillus sp. L9]|uniref:DeoR family transcriptional regulator n=1 Tax=Ornithinibacillus caprae TaxID=2678566 RepID=A0A6N8FR57_9BACI|nr:DeoR family transcriptional regulator [Ornithinibacillus caprae]MUK90208.1 DeoR family transcriptional regulator [Ornithinibacillus caprae]